MAKEYVHESGREVQAIAGWYILEREEKLNHKGKEFLYLVGDGCVESSCCGSGDCHYVVVPGLIVSWKAKMNDEGLAISVVEPVEEEEVKKEICRSMSRKEGVNEIHFW